jgi:hypothetical protein
MDSERDDGVQGQPDKFAISEMDSQKNELHTILSTLGSYQSVGLPLNSI